MKSFLLDQLISNLKKEISLLSEAHDSTKSFATDQEFKAESKYDTRSLEASYLASAESKRLEELKLDLQMLEDIELKDSNKFNEICSGSLVTLEFRGINKKYFLVPISGGDILEVGGEPVLIISLFSPLGSSVLGLKKGDQFEVETPKDVRIYKVIDFI
jgi:transcription elongation GreA/GreB family factor